MEEVTISGVDFVENVFKLSGAEAEGAVVFHKMQSRPYFTRVVASRV